MNLLSQALIKLMPRTDVFKELTKSLDPYLTVPPMTTSELVTVFCGIIVAVSLAGLFYAPIGNYLALCAVGTKGVHDPWRIFTYGFVHVGIVHLAGNLLAIYSFLMLLTQVVTFKACMVVFTLGVVIPGWLATHFRAACPHPYAVGASCGIGALIACAAVTVPDGQIRFFFLITMPLWTGVLVIIGLSLLFIWRGLLPGIWHQGHILGIMTGLIASWVLF